MTITLRTVAALRKTVSDWRKAGDTISLVPTMGALHEGHLALVHEGRRLANRVVATIFVNPMQFAANEDFSRYPRPFEADLAKLTSVDCDAVFAPSLEEMYPPGDVTCVSLGGPAEAGLEDKARPTHFNGVATVVTKLLLQALPDIAIFGEKDWQQLAVIRQFTRDLMIPVTIHGFPTERAPDGLALSSRNAYLSAEHRAKAPAIYRALKQAAEAIRAGAAPDDACARAAGALTSEGFEVNYVVACDATTLAKPKHNRDSNLRLIAAARLGTTRLIDNIAVSDTENAPDQSSIRR
jgi:pantoate--beta-alanine ligase